LDREDEAGEESDRDEDLIYGHRAVSWFDLKRDSRGLFVSPVRLGLLCLAIDYIAAWRTR